MSYTGKIEDLIAERDELRATLTAVSDSLDYLHGMTSKQAAEVRKDAERFRWLRSGRGSAAAAQHEEAADKGWERVNWLYDEDLDTVIDAEMAAAPAVGAAERFGNQEPTR